MRQTSFTMDIIPSPTSPGYCMVHVKRLDVEDGEWGDVKYLLDERMYVDLIDVPEDKVEWAAVDTFQRVLRLFVSKLNESDSEHK